MTGHPDQSDGRCADRRPALGSLAVGALEPAEEAEARAHLRVCASCAAEAASLGAVAGFLGRVDAADLGATGQGGASGAPPLAASVADAGAGAPWPVPGLLPRILGEARRRRRRRRAVVAAVAAACALLFGLAGGVVASAWLGGSGTADVARPDRTDAAGEPGAGQRVRLSGRDGATGVWADLQLSPRSWGTSVEMTLGGVPAGQVCELVALGRGGRREVGATWGVPEGGYDAGGATAGVLTLTGSVGQPLSEIDRFEVVTAAGVRLLEIRAS